MAGPRTLLFLSVLALGASPERGRATAEVAVSALEVFGGPSDVALPTGKIRRGGKVAVVGDEPGGWVAIVPPRGSFSWIAGEAIEPVGPGLARVVAPTAPVRPGSAGARMPGAPRTSLPQGAEVRLLDRPALVLRQEGAPRTFLAIEPTDEEVRYVRAEGLGPIRSEPPANAAGAKVGPDRPPPVRQVARAAEPEVRVDRHFADAGPVLDESRLPAALATKLAQIEQEHRAILRRPVETWRLDPIRRRYETLIGQSADPAAEAALRARLDRVNRQETVAKASATIKDVLGRSRARDLALAEARSRTRATGPRSARSHDAAGLLQISSKQVEGQRVFALIGESGETSAYLRLPPGLPVERYLTRRIGVRGTVGYDESLRARVITVRDLEPLADAPVRRQ